MRKSVAALLLAASLVAVSSGQRALAQAGDADDRFTLTADTLTNDDERDLVIASGNVEVSRAGYRLLADTVTYDQARDRVQARGNVVLIDPGGDAYFGTELDVSGDLKEGVVQAVRVLRADDSRLAANRAVREGGTTTTLDRAVYSPCPVCAGEDANPLWQIRANRVVQDGTAQTITYRDAVFEMFGVPIAYTPWFQHPQPGADKQSGLLAPTLGTRSELGLFAQVPYYYVLAPNQDLTLAPIITQEAGPVLAGEYRDLRTFGETQLGGSVTYTETYEREGQNRDGNDLRGHFEGEGRYPLGDLDEAGFDAFLASDAGYLDRYGISGDDVLENRVFAEALENRDFFLLEGLYFQGLREDDDQDRIPVALPIAEANLISEPWRWGSHWTVDTSLLALTRNEGLDTRRASVRGGWQLPLLGAIGDEWTIETSLRGDLYYLDGNTQNLNGDGGDSSEGRLLPRFTVDWRWPWIGDGLGWGFELEPLASLNLAPGGGNSDGIPNEDSRDFEFDETNLLEPIRFAGLDRNEGGGKLAYGLRWSGVGPRGLEVDGLVGQSWRLYGDSPFREGTGLEDPFSDYVGRVGVRPASWLDLTYRFRLDHEDASLRRSALGLTAGPAWLKIDANYVNLSREPGAADDDDDGEDEFDLDSREELVLGVRSRITDRLQLGARTRQDVSRGATVANQLGLIYSHPCLIVSLGAEQSYTRTGESGDETTVLLRLAFATLGDIETGAFPGL